MGFGRGKGFTSIVKQEVVTVATKSGGGAYRPTLTESNPSIVAKGGGGAHRVTLTELNPSYSTEVTEPTYTEEQTEGGLLQWLYGPTAATRGGQRLTITNRDVITLAFKAQKSGSPTGDVTFTIRKVSDDSIIASKVWGDASAIVAGEWMEVTFDTPVTVNEEVRILFEFTGGNANNRIGHWGSGTDVKAGEYYTRYLSGAYNNVTSWDSIYRYTYS